MQTVEQVHGSDVADLLEDFTEVAIFSKNDAVLGDKYQENAKAPTAKANTRSGQAISEAQFYKAVESDISANAKSRDAVADFEVFSDYTTEITVIENIATEETATIRFHELTEYDREVDLEAEGVDIPTTMGELNDYIFHFKKQDSEWVLVSRDHVNALAEEQFLVGEDGEMIPFTPPAMEKGTDFWPQRHSVYIPISQGGANRASEVDETNNRAAEAVTGLNKEAVKNYALQYALSPNSNYRHFHDNDCTNFVSQALHAGGWSIVHGQRNNYYSWYYAYWPSYTWSSVYHFHNFVGASRRGWKASHYTQLNPGDVVVIGDRYQGNYSHSSVVTGKGSYRKWYWANWSNSWQSYWHTELYLSYHSTNRKNVSYSWFRSQYLPDANVIGWVMH